MAERDPRFVVFRLKKLAHELILFTPNQRCYLPVDHCADGTILTLFDEVSRPPNVTPRLPDLVGYRLIQDPHWLAILELLHRVEYIKSGAPDLKL